MRIAVAGHLCVDLAPALERMPSLVGGGLVPVGPLAAQLGGSVANCARVFRSLGVDCHVSARIGPDALGRLALELLAAEGFDAGEMEIDDDSSTSYSIVVEPPGRDRVFWHHAGANDRFTGENIDLSNVDAVHVGYPSLLGAMRVNDGAALIELFERAHEAGALTSLDLAVVDSEAPAAQTSWRSFLTKVLPHTDVVSPSSDDLRSIATSLGDEWAAAGPDYQVAQLVEMGAAIALVSSGSDGVHLAAGDGQRLAFLGGRADGWTNAREHHAPHEVKVVRTTNGAGDATSAGFLTAILQGATPAEAAAMATEAAAAVVSGALRDVSAVESTILRGERKIVDRV